MNLAEMRRHRPGDTVDAVVIGTGAGGAPIAARLAEAGLDVVALEAGPNHAADYPADEIDAAPIYWLGERLSAGETPEAFGANNSGTGLGGSTLHWGAFAPRPDPRDLRLHTEFGVGADWPFGLETLLPYLVQAERDIGVSGPAAYPWDLARRYALPPVAPNAPARAMQAGCRALGITTAMAPAAVLTEDRGARQACVNCGHCHQGCRNGAKASMDVTYLPRAVAAGAELRPGCFAHGFGRDATGHLTAVLYREGGAERRQRCRAVFLCAGAVETPRLLLHAGLANSSGQIGRNYMAHVATQLWGSFPAEMRCNKGYPSSLITEDMIRAPDADYAGGYLVQSLGVLPLTWAEGVARSRGLWGQPLTDYLLRYNHVAGIGINGECLPNPANYLELSDETDDTGLPKPRIHFSGGENERVLSRHAEAMMRGVWEAAGATDLWVNRRSAHTIGTCRMGHDPDTAVVNPRRAQLRRAEPVCLRQLGVSERHAGQPGADHHGAGAAHGGGVSARTGRGKLRSHIGSMARGKPDLAELLRHQVAPAATVVMVRRLRGRDLMPVGVLERKFVCVYTSAEILIPFLSRNRRGNGGARRARRRRRNPPYRGTATPRSRENPSYIYRYLGIHTVARSYSFLCRRKFSR